LSRARASRGFFTPDTSFEPEALSFLRALEHEPGTIRGCFSLPACRERALAGLRLNLRLEQRCRTNLTECFEENVPEPVASAANSKILGFHRAGEESRFLCRVIQRDGSFNYLDFVVERSRLASCTVMDAYDYSAGLKLSEIARSMVEARAQETQKNDHQWLLGSRSEPSQHGNAIDRFQRFARDQKVRGSTGHLREAAAGHAEGPAGIAYANPLRNGSRPARVFGGARARLFQAQETSRAFPRRHRAHRSGSRPRRLP
jgi:hypothetical protein